MRLVKRNINRDGSGFVVLYPEEPEDMVCGAMGSSILEVYLHHAVACIQSHQS